MFQRLKRLVRTIRLLQQAECLTGLQEIAADIRLRKTIMGDKPGLVLEQDTIVSGYEPDRLCAGQARVARGTVLSFGDDRTGFGRITIGQQTWIGQYNNLRASLDADIKIGSHCLISQFCTLVAANHSTDLGMPIMCQPQDSARRGIQLGNDVWLGAGVTILPGVQLANGAVIGAGSVVTRDVPANEIWVGVPAHKHGERKPSEA